MPRSSRTRRILPINRRVLFGLLALVVLVFGTSRIVHGSGGHRASPPAISHHTLPQSRKPAAHLHKPRVHHAPHVSALQSYAIQLVPVLDRTRAVFDQTTAQTVGAPASGLDGTCSSQGNRISLLDSRADGVPHPAAWYDPVAAFHRQMMAIYHRMEGALLNCVDGADNNDGVGLSLSEHDIAGADHQMRALDDRARQLAKRAGRR